LAHGILVVGIEECDVLARRISEAQVSRCTHTQVPMPFVLEVAHLSVKGSRVPQRYFGAPIGGTIVNQQKLPVCVCLRKHTLDGLLDECLCIEKDDDD
jgi:hypothetical protein